MSEKIKQTVIEILVVLFLSAILYFVIKPKTMQLNTLQFVFLIYLPAKLLYTFGYWLVTRTRANTSN